MTTGILFYNSGTKCLPRLLVAVNSLRKVYSGNVCILSQGDESRNICKSIANYYSCIFQEFVSDISDLKHFYWFEKSRMHKYSPFDYTIFIDSDTLILKDPSELFDEIKENDFIATQFSNWTTHTPRIAKRLSPWAKIDKDLTEFTLRMKSPSVNVGVYGFSKESELMRNWFDFTIQLPDAILPEESSCHLMLNKYKGIVVESKYNCSCKHDIVNGETVIIHYHGRKHCRRDDVGNYLYNAEKWVKEFLEVIDDDICGIKEWRKFDSKLDKII